MVIGGFGRPDIEEGRVKKTLEFTTRTVLV
jgi:hypothetical protein